MIKTGIYGSSKLDDPVRKQLLRLLLRHPDVDLRAVASPAGTGIAIADLHPVYAGDTRLTLERQLRIEGLDVLFVIDEENLTPDILEYFDTHPDFKIILLGNAPSSLDGERPADFIYGLPEYYRKALVRGARAAVLPRPEALIIELALLPLAKKGLLPEGAFSMLSLTTSEPERLTAAVEEASRELGTINNAKVSLSIAPAPEAPYERMDLFALVPTKLPIEEIRKIYTEAYEDHSFVHMVDPATEIDEDMRGSNKCLLQLSKTDGADFGTGESLVINATMDALTKGITGNAVHVMDLLFGLLERTGLSI